VERKKRDSLFIIHYSDVDGRRYFAPIAAMENHFARSIRARGIPYLRFTTAVIAGTCRTRVCLRILQSIRLLLEENSQNSKAKSTRVGVERSKISYGVNFVR